MRDPNWQPKPEADPSTIIENTDITRNKREFTALIRRQIFHFLQPLIQRRYAAAAAIVPPWTAEQLEEIMQNHEATHEPLRLDPEARNSRHTYISANDPDGKWTVQQVLVDEGESNDWQVTFRVDLAQARETGLVMLVLEGIGAVV